MCHALLTLPDCIEMLQRVCLAMSVSSDIVFFANNKRIWLIDGVMNEMNEKRDYSDIPRVKRSDSTSVKYMKRWTSPTSILRSCREGHCVYGLWVCNFVLYRMQFVLYQLQFALHCIRCSYIVLHEIQFVLYCNKCCLHYIVSNAVCILLYLMYFVLYVDIVVSTAVCIVSYAVCILFYQMQWHSFLEVTSM